jgi:hypothetical protein
MRTLYFLWRHVVNRTALALATFGNITHDLDVISFVSVTHPKVAKASVIQKDLKWCLHSRKNKYLSLPILGRRIFSIEIALLCKNSSQKSLV